VYLGVGVTAVPTLLQTWGQKHVPSERAVVVYAMDPVYAALFAHVLLGEEMGARVSE